MITIAIHCAKDADPGSSTQPIHSDNFTSLPFSLRLSNVGSNPEMLKHNMGAQILASPGNRGRLRKHWIGISAIEYRNIHEVVCALGMQWSQDA